MPMLPKSRNLNTSSVTVSYMSTETIRSLWISLNTLALVSYRSTPHCVTLLLRHMCQIAISQWLVQTLPPTEITLVNLFTNSRHSSKVLQTLDWRIILIQLRQFRKIGEWRLSSLRKHLWWRHRVTSFKDHP